MKQIFILILITFSFVQLNAQKEYYNDIVYLKNGSKIYGQILDYKIGDKVEVKLSSGQILTFKDDVVKKIEVYSPEDITKQKINVYKFKNNVFYNNFGIKIISGANSVNTKTVVGNGVGIEYSLGYRYKHYFSSGLGVALESYNYGLGELFIPLYFDFIGFYKKSEISPFFKFQVGYSFVKTNKDNVIDSEGGMMYNPAFGIKYSGKGDLNYMVDINFKYQKASFVYTSNGWREQIIYRDVIFRRISFRFSILF